jgi:peroxiredoxin
MKMNKYTLLAAAISISQWTLAQKEYHCIIRLTDLKLSATAYLVSSYGWTNQRILDSAEGKNGIFRFKGKLSDPMAVHAVVLRNGEKIQHYNKNADAQFFYLEQGDILIKGKDAVKKAVVTGSALNMEYAKYRATVLKPMEQVEEQASAMYKAGVSNGRLDDRLTDSLMLLFKMALRQTDSLKWIYISQHPTSYLSLVALKELAGNDPDVEKIAPVYKKFPATLRSTNTGKELARLLYDTGPASIGAMAPDFTQNDVHDQPVKLSNFRGKYVLLDFWASWCGPCRAENPNVVKAYQKYKDKNFTVLGVSLDQAGKKEAWLAAIERDGLSWTHVSDLKFWNNEAAKLYGVRAIPQNFLIDPNGKIIAKNLRGEALEQKLAALIE